MDAAQAKAFAQKIVGEEAGGEYLISPIPRAFMEGVIGAVATPYDIYNTSPGSLQALGEFFREVGDALTSEAERLAG